MNRLRYDVKDIQRHIFEEGGFKVSLSYLSSLSSTQLADLAAVYIPTLAKALDEGRTATVTVTNGSSDTFNIGFPSHEDFQRIAEERKKRYEESMGGRCPDSQVFLFKNRWVVPTTGLDAKAADASERYADFRRDAAFNRESRNDYIERFLEGTA